MTKILDNNCACLISLWEGDTEGRHTKESKNVLRNKELNGRKKRIKDTMINRNNIITENKF